jgi:hypothetical protein
LDLGADHDKQMPSKLRTSQSKVLAAYGSSIAFASTGSAATAREPEASSWRRSS